VADDSRANRDDVRSAAERDDGGDARGDGRGVETGLGVGAEPNGARAELLLRALQACGAPVERAVLTDNRRTLISLAGAERRTIRIHWRFADADPQVIRAVADFVRLRRGKARSDAVRVIRTFARAFPSVPPKPRRRRVYAVDVPHLERLQAEFERVNTTYFGGALPRVPIHLSGRMRRRNGHFSSHPLEIVVSRSLCLHAAGGEAEHTLRHEMIHLWQHQSGSRLGHGPDFRHWARLLDVHPRAAREVRWRPAARS
jgi:hypothetical protein